MPTAVLLGVPSDAGAGVRGASMGPEALRVAGLAQALQRQGLTVHDRGNLQGPINPQHPPVEGYRHLPEVAAWNRQVYEQVLHTLGAGHLPLVLGGDHTFAVGSISAVARHCRASGRALRVIWLDSHADCNTAELTPSGNMHGMPVACLLGMGPPELTGLAGHTPALQAAEIRQIGIRSVDEGERALVHTLGLEVFDMRYIDEMGMRHTLAQALLGVEADTHVHVSFDVDFLTPEIAPGVATTVLGGPTYREAQLCMEMLADTGCVRSVDLMELNPALDVRNQTAQVMVDLTESLFGKSTLMRR
ncbi:arginase [Limnohabitans sp.]|uniref:arginase n=1 Tax=Limnohabitans sp. TaxID=1907725 RepID=UPI00391CD577